MTDSSKEKMLDLLTDEVLFGLDENERAELKDLEKMFPELRSDKSLELAVSAVSFTNLNVEPMPERLQRKILADAETFFAQKEMSNVVPFQSQLKEVASEVNNDEIQKTFELERKRPLIQWLGWAFAGAFAVVLVFNTFFVSPPPPRVVIATPTPTVTPLTPAMEREQLLASATDIVETEWGDLDPKKAQNLKGDVVWSNSLQKGYLRFTNLPVNDKTKETYQLWIMDEYQKHPIDGGIFDANEAGEIIVPIDARLKVIKPKMFAVTAEKPGGVVVSPLEKVMAVAKVTT